MLASFSIRVNLYLILWKTLEIYYLGLSGDRTDRSLRCVIDVCFLSRKVGYFRKILQQSTYAVDSPGPAAAHAAARPPPILRRSSAVRQCLAATKGDGCACE